jgi:uncharacterized protein (TIGR03435 family)
MRFLFLLAGALTLTAQTFEVATIRPAQYSPNTPDCGLRPAPGNLQYIAKCTSARPILWTSYWLKSSQIIGGPDWLDTDRWDIVGQAPRTSTIDELHIMMQNLFVERFRLQSHHEQREMPVYVLTIDPKGAKNLIRHDTKNASDVSIEQSDERPNHKWNARFAPMNFLAWRLSMWLDRPIINQTGLEGSYDFGFAFSDDVPLGAQLPPARYEVVFNALREQLGLRLESRRAPADVLVIDHIERPTDN